MERVLEDQTWMAEDLLLPHTLGRSFYVRPDEREQIEDRKYFSNSAFWKDILDPQKATAERIVALNGFNVFEWIPRNPGLYHTERGAQARIEAQYHIRSIDHGDSRKFHAD